MTKLNITQAAKVVGKDRRTIQRHIKDGKLSCEQTKGGRKVIDASELIRAYGEIENPAALAALGQKETKPQQTAPQNSDKVRQENTNLQDQIVDLKQDKTDLKGLLEKEQTRGREREKELQSHIVEQQKTISQQLMLLKAPEPEPTEQPTAATSVPKPVPNPTPIKKQSAWSKFWKGKQEVTGG